MRNKIWTPEEINFLKENYLKNGGLYCANELNRTIASIRGKTKEYNLIIDELWTDDEETILTKNYSNKGPKGCEAILPNRSKKSILHKAQRMGLIYEEQIWNTNNFIKKAKITHGNLYDYSKSSCSKFNDKVIIICDKHGEFIQRANCHVVNGYGCPICKQSKGEKEIRNFLINNNINFIPQHTFKNCKNINILPFDFYLPDYNTCIEYNGVQHYEIVNYFGGEKEFKKRISRDKIKKEYCYNNNIPLLIIKYNDNITFQLKNYLNVV